MTHEELLAKVNRNCENSGDVFAHALCVTVELHTPNNFILHGSDVQESWCECGRGTLNPYPCATIRAIENELK